MSYRPEKIEKKWQSYWEDHRIDRVENDFSKPKFYVLDMFPYPSGAGLHVGHPLGYISTDIMARFKKMQGFNVLHPMGFDSFGLPAEQYAIQMGIHPEKSTEKNIRKFKAQLRNLGLNYDWSREVITSDPSFYKWTQWIFLNLYKHYYDLDLDRAVPINQLTNKFEQSGNVEINAATTQTETFTGEAWNSMTAKEHDEILMNYRLAYRKTTYVNWCEALGTVLANDEVKDGVSERGGFPVEKRPMLQWSLRITAYAERLLNDLDSVEWSDALKAMQRNWIGRSEGAQLFFELKNSNEKIEIFTTRADTIFGATFMVLAPEHDLVDQLTTDEHKIKVSDYKKYVKGRSEIDRMAEVKKVTGAFTGSYAINPFTKSKIPVWIAEYVLKDYGTGAIMAVPSDDERDLAFAQKFGIEVIDVVDKSAYPGATLHDKLGKLINSQFLDGMEVPDAIEEMLNRIESMGIGTRQVNYKLRDANYSRQRYWGEPFPIYYDDEGVSHSLPESSLPLELPELEDFKPGEGGRSPLSRKTDWVNFELGTRETDTMPGFAGSSWYFLRYMDPKNEQEFASKEAIDYWQEVDLYVGGTEHAVGHLMYSRFWNKFLYDKGLVSFLEPFKKLINQGMIQGVIEYLYLQKEKQNGFSRFLCAKLSAQEDENKFVKIPILIDLVRDYGTPNSYLDLDGIKKFIDWRPEYKDAIFECSKGVFHKGIFTPKVEASIGSHLFTESEIGKMGKRYYNAVNPDDVVDKYGADTLRMYEMFLGPIQQAKPWDTKGIDGVSKFLKKLWSLYFDENDTWKVKDQSATTETSKVLHAAIKKVSEDIEKFSFNTAVSAFMVCANELKKLDCRSSEILEPLIKLLAPFAPHITEEIWQHFKRQEISVHKTKMPSYDPDLLVESTITYPISINGKKRGEANFSADRSKEELTALALELEVVKKWTEGKKIKKVIVVPSRMINIVV